MPKNARSRPVSRLYNPAAITVGYVAGAALWITLSDRALERLVPDATMLATIGTVKGYLFCAVTGALLFGLLSAWDRARRRAAFSAEHSRERLERVMSSSNDGWWDWNIVSGERYYSPHWYRMLGYAPEELPAQPDLWLTLVHPSERDACRERLERTLASDTPNDAFELHMRHKDGHYVTVLTRYSVRRDAMGNPVSVSGTNIDLTQLRDVEERLEFVAHHDPLTRLPNRRLLATQVEHVLRSAQREQGEFAVLQLDLDRFKDINESYGHALGDEVLVQVAEALRRCVRETDTVARPGGDEFMVVLERIAHAEDAARIANDIIERLGQEWPLSNGARVRTGVSIGISLYPQHGASTSELFQHADAAMYLAKHEGRNCFRYFSEHLTRSARERIELETELHLAIPRAELCVHFQPQVSIADGSVTGAEALVRWEHPERGLIPPGNFIPIAETSNLISEIGNWVLRETCRQGRAWLDAGMAPMTLAVNVSPRQFNTAGFAPHVRQVLDETGFPAHCLELEMTESALMARGEKAVSTLAELRQLGVRLAIDDFGTGYSSLAYLKNFPLDVLKIDRSFVKDIPEHADDMAIASAIIDMAHTLGFQVLAEGVETREQLEFLSRQGCDTYQGFLKGKPAPAEEFERILADCQVRIPG